MIEPTYATHDVHGNELSEEQQEALSEMRPRLSPFTKSNWKTAESRDMWRDLLIRVAESISEVEWLSVLDDRTDRSAAIIHVHHENRDRWLKRVSEHDLCYERIRWQKKFDGYNSKFDKADGDDPNRMSYSVVSKNQDIADKVKEIESRDGGPQGEERHRQLAKFLGFPECCVEKFIDVWLGQDRIDPIYEIACNSSNAELIDDNPNHIRLVDPEPWANILFRSFGWSYISHLPCSFDCEKSHKIAQQRGEIMAENGYREEANELFRWINQPHVWSGYKSQSRIANAHFLGASQTSAYWNKKRVVWGEEHPRESVI